MSSKSLFSKLLAAAAVWFTAAGSAQAVPFTLWVTETPAGGTAQFNAQFKGGVRSYVFDGAGYALANITAGATIAAAGLNDPSAVAADAAGNLLISDRGFNQGSGGVSKVTFASGVANAPTTVLAGLPTGPHQAALTADGGLIVSSLGSGAQLHPGVSGAATLSFATGTQRGAAVGSGFLYATAGSGALQVFDVADASLDATFSVSGASLLHYATLYGGSLWLADIGSDITGAGGGIYRVTLGANGLPTASTRVASVDGAISVAFSPNGDEMIVATHFGGQLVGFALSGGNVAASSNFVLDGGSLASWGGAHVQFGGMAVTSAVPEPASGALLLVGVGMLGFAARRRASLAAPLLAASVAAQAAYNDPIAFTAAGTVTLKLDDSVGGYDHILELADNTGAVGATPLLALTENGANASASVLGFLPAALGDVVTVGSFTAGQELVFRLTNVESARLGTPGVLGGQVFSGSASGLNATPGGIYTWVEYLSPTTIRVSVEDLFAIDPLDPDLAANFDDGKDVVFTLTLTPVPEPQRVGLLLAGLGVVGWVMRRRAG